MDGPAGRPVTSARGAVGLPVHGSQCSLRAWSEEDVPRFREWLRPHHEWRRWDGPYYPLPTEAEADALAAGTLLDADDGLPPRRVVIADAEGRLIGVASWYWESEVSAWARIGLALYDPAVRGRGIGREALALWTSFLFAHTDWVRLDLATWSGNHAMVRCALAAGYVEEGRFRRAREVRGQRYDSVVLGVLREEWPAHPPFPPPMPRPLTPRRALNLGR